ncbi:hypothetical protein [Candidatus Schmidhempelia bombi]|uniref:Uncharacterized protein n=1 Tax=Candidatus Schmidhempelia bombi str. Bimp TaxID=1387197 RepID=A0AB94IA17_9GAMM|nr:hypothetical protein [Candidatus Schmidhempelia bombi]TEA26223.1 hypothetical protein O970_09775 [Candidatus Schmidhempelia bombi str. Bimp]
MKYQENNNLKYRNIDNMKKRITVEYVFFASLLTFIVCLMLPYDSYNKPYLLVAIVGSFSSFIAPVSFVLWIIKAIKTRNNRQKQNLQSIETYSQKNSFLEKSTKN